MSHLHIFRIRIAVGYDAAAGLYDYRTVFPESRPDRDAQVRVAVGTDIACASAVKAALFGFQLFDDLRRPVSSERPTTFLLEASAERSHRRKLRFNRSGYRRTQVHDPFESSDMKIIFN